MSLETSGHTNHALLHAQLIIQSKSETCDGEPSKRRKEKRRHAAHPSHTRTSSEEEASSVIPHATHAYDFPASTQLLRRTR